MRGPQAACQEMSQKVGEKNRRMEVGLLGIRAYQALGRAFDLLATERRC